jgi:hypothetical protein
LSFVGLLAHTLPVGLQRVDPVGAYSEKPSAEHFFPATFYSNDCIVELAALEIIVYSAVFCLPVLIPLAATDKNNVKQKAAKGDNYTYTDFDNLGMGNIQVRIS